MTLNTKNLEHYKELVREEPFLEGENIFLEGLTEKHVCQRYANWLNDKEVCKENSHGRVHNTLEMTRNYVLSVDKAENIAVFAIIAKDGNQHVGNISLGNISWKNKSGEISILIGEKDYWGKGLGTEAYRLVIDYGFRMLDLHRLYSGMTVRNIGMAKVAQNVGMSFEGTSREAFFKDGEFIDIAHYAIINPKHRKKIEVSDENK